MNRALCIGLNYDGTSSALGGCHNDAIFYEHFFRTRYPTTSTRLVLDSEKHKVSKQDVLKHFKWLCEDPQPPFLFFTYSGHGTQKPDSSSEEEDKKDEACYMTTGELLTDDEISKFLLRKVNEKTTLFCIIDACHSGSMGDLPFFVRPNGDSLSNFQLKKATETAANVWMLSGCSDPQTSMDVFLSGKRGGALTFGFEFAAKKRENLVNGGNIYLLYLEIIKWLRQRGFTQIPILSFGKLSQRDEQWILQLGENGSSTV